jgi:hypothetical protein
VQPRNLVEAIASRMGQLGASKANEISAAWAEAVAREHG